MSARIPQDVLLGNGWLTEDPAHPFWVGDTSSSAWVDTSKIDPADRHRADYPMMIKWFTGARPVERRLANRSEPVDLATRMLLLVRERRDC